MDADSLMKTVVHGDVLGNISSYLEWREVVHLRQVASSWKEAVTEAPIEEQIHVKTQRVLFGLKRCLPKLQSLKVDQSSEVSLLLHDHDDDDDDRRSLLLYQFSNIKHFQCLHTTPSLLEGYDLRDMMTHHWQDLQSLNLHGNEQLEWKLSDLSSLKRLRDLRCINNRCLQGDTQDLLLQHKQPDKSGGTTTSSSGGATGTSTTTTSLFHSMIILDISGCIQVTGRLRDFAKMPKLQWLGINRTQVKGDLRHDIRPGDFVALQGMGLCSQAVYGASQIQSVADASAVMKARLQIMKQSTWESPIWPLMLHLSPDSSDYHERVEQRLYTSERDPPFSIETVVVANRWGWRWSNYLGGFCDTHWLDPEPKTTDYKNELTLFQAEQSSLFSGFLDPPTPEQYRVLCQERCL